MLNGTDRVLIPDGACENPEFEEISAVNTCRTHERGSQAQASSAKKSRCAFFTLSQAPNVRKNDASESFLRSLWTRETDCSEVERVIVAAFRVCVQKSRVYRALVLAA